MRDSNRVPLVGRSIAYFWSRVNSMEKGPLELGMRGALLRNLPVHSLVSNEARLDSPPFRNVRDRDHRNLPLS